MNMTSVGFGKMQNTAVNFGAVPQAKQDEKAQMNTSLTVMRVTQNTKPFTSAS